MGNHTGSREKRDRSASLESDTVAAIATPTGFGGVGIVRVSGPRALRIAEALVGFLPKPRYAHFSHFKSANGESIDSGLILYFPGPKSFTGEDVVEIQGHGGPIITDLLQKRVLELGARQARPGEFTERAFLNGKIDLAQAEAVSDLIHASSEAGALSASRSLSGAFSQEISELREKVESLRVFVEAAIDFPEEEIDFLADEAVLERLSGIQDQLMRVFESASQGVLIREGVRLVIAGAPNVGKSTLLNCLTGEETAIITPTAGTTRDLIRETVQVGGQVVHCIDTAGIRDTTDEIEKVGIEKAKEALSRADLVLWLVDKQPTEASLEAWFSKLDGYGVDKDKVIVVQNKIDLDAPITPSKDFVQISAKKAIGIQALNDEVARRTRLSSSNEGVYSARRRHLEALKRAKNCLETAVAHINNGDGELLAEDLRGCRNELGEIVGEYHTEDLLGDIFSGFCIGK